jgi:hypothetical protein
VVESRSFIDFWFSLALDNPNNKIRLYMILELCINRISGPYGHLILALAEGWLASLKLQHMNTNATDRTPRSYFHLMIIFQHFSSNADQVTSF